MNLTSPRLLGALALALAIAVCAPEAIAQKPVVQSISVGQPQIVLAPDGSGNPINAYGGLQITSDEHPTIFPPGALQNSDYLFFVASGANGSALGAVVLSGGSGPDKNGQWTFDFAQGYGFYGASGYAPVLLPATGPKCPAAPGSDPTKQDSTFDLSYAAPGSVVLDPTDKPGSLLMLYEGCNTCAGIGTAFNPTDSNAYITVAVATSTDYGRTWPTYRGTSSFAFVPMPGLDRTTGPNAGMGATGASVCMGNDCTTPPPPAYGRYAAIGPVSSLSSLIAAGKQLGGNLGMGESSAFLDDVNPNNTAPYVYDVSGYKTASADPPLPGGRSTDLVIARAQLNGGTAPLQFSKWNGSAYKSAGLGGSDMPFLPQTGAYQNCGATNQVRHDGTIDYVDDTQQYLLMFVCDSPTDPISGSGAGGVKGAAWFWATSPTLENPTLWSGPQEIGGTWAVFDTSGQCFAYPGWYAGWMSLGKRQGHLSNQGYVFVLDGCETAGTPGGRKFASRAFTITTSGGTKRRAAAHR